MLKLALLLSLWVLPIAFFALYVWKEHKTKLAQAPMPRPDEERRYLEYQEFLNDRIGFFSFTFALASLGTGSPQFYALLSLIFVLIIWALRVRDFQLAIQRWRKEESWRLSIWSICRRFPVFMLGYLSLLAVLLGLLGKSTLEKDTAEVIAGILRRL